MTLKQMKTAVQSMFTNVNGAIETVSDEGSENLTAKDVSLTGEENLLQLMEKIAEIDVVNLFIPSSGDEEEEGGGGGGTSPTSQTDVFVQFTESERIHYLVWAPEGVEVTEPKPPVSYSGHGFMGWYDSEDATEQVSFPYIPYKPITILNARFTQNYGLLCAVADDVMFTINDGTRTVNAIKSNTGFSLCGYCKYNYVGNTSIVRCLLFCISQDEPSAIFDSDTGFCQDGGTITYKEETWYIKTRWVELNGTDISGLGRHYYGNKGNWYDGLREEVVTAMLEQAEEEGII